MENSRGGTGGRKTQEHVGRKNGASCKKKKGTTKKERGNGKCSRRDTRDIKRQMGERKRRRRTDENKTNLRKTRSTWRVAKRDYYPDKKRRARRRKKRRRRRGQEKHRGNRTEKRWMLGGKLRQAGREKGTGGKRSAARKGTRRKERVENETDDDIRKWAIKRLRWI